jgi:hypothetical protein
MRTSRWVTPRLRLVAKAADFALFGWFDCPRNSAFEVKLMQRLLCLEPA